MDPQLATNEAILYASTIYLHQLEDYDSKPVDNCADRIKLLEKSLQLCEALQIRLVTMGRFVDSTLVECSNMNIHKLISELPDSDVPDKFDLTSLRQIPSRETVCSVIGEVVPSLNNRRKVDQALVCCALCKTQKRSSNYCRVEKEHDAPDWNALFAPLQQQHQPLPTNHRRNYDFWSEEEEKKLEDAIVLHGNDAPLLAEAIGSKSEQQVKGKLKRKRAKSNAASRSTTGNTSMAITTT